MVNFKSLFGGIYKGRRVLITGHTGFKGSWLVLWLQILGAKVHGYALAPPSNPSHIELLRLKIEDAKADIRDFRMLSSFVKKVKPEIVFHLAAQSLVRPSYSDPIETYSTNVMGTLHLFEACRKVDSVKAIVNVTSDKCYENKEWKRGYKETDAMGGFDPYSSSKGCAELLTASYRNSFFNPSEYKKTHSVLLASTRAGNVIGGGDWAKDRLIPDLIKSASKKAKTTIRNLQAVRPWQHVLEPLSGYLTLGWQLLEGEREFADGWNFGPAADSNLSVKEVVAISKTHWDAIVPVYSNHSSGHHEAKMLMLNCSKANKLLKWKPVWTAREAIGKTILWYNDYYAKGKILSENNIAEYVERANKIKPSWVV